ncbi:MAG: hypothetical protein LN588_02995 [Rickettsia endosymbiont of Bryobia graminum]|nr:hypothetical protein [Rickettsia endosymbiont of Bryobia graminum]
MAEHIVRYPEFAVMELQEKLSDNPEIMTSFKDLASYWDNYVMKDIDGYLEDYVSLSGET